MAADRDMNKLKIYWTFLSSTSLESIVSKEESAEADVYTHKIRSELGGMWPVKPLLYMSVIVYKEERDNSRVESPVEQRWPCPSMWQEVSPEGKGLGLPSAVAEVATKRLVTNCRVGGLQWYKPGDVQSGLLASLHGEDTLVPA
jgi:hypothetical protein